MFVQAATQIGHYRGQFPNLITRVRKRRFGLAGAFPFPVGALAFPVSAFPFQRQAIPIPVSTLAFQCQAFPVGTVPFPIGALGFAHCEPHLNTSWQRECAVP